MVSGIDSRGLHEEASEVKQRQKIHKKTPGKLGQRIYALRKELQSAKEKCKLAMKKVKALTAEDKRLRLLKRMEAQKLKEATMVSQNNRKKEDGVRNKPCRYGLDCLSTKKRGWKCKFSHNHSLEYSIYNTKNACSEKMENHMKMHSPRQPEYAAQTEENFSPILGWENHAESMVNTNIHNNPQNNLQNQQDLMPKLHAENIANTNNLENNSTNQQNNLMPKLHAENMANTNTQNNQQNNLEDNPEENNPEKDNPEEDNPEDNQQDNLEDNSETISKTIRKMKIVHNQIILTASWLIQMMSKTQKSQSLRHLKERPRIMKKLSSLCLTKLQCKSVKLIWKKKLQQNQSH
jgi:hypothetical protein